MNKKPAKGLSVLIILSLLITMSVNVPLIFAYDTANRLVNTGFEETQKATSGWDQLGAANWSVWKPTGKPIVSISEDAAHSGKYGLKITAAETARASVNQDVPVKGGKTYLLSTWLKTDNIVSGQGARIRVTTFEKGQQLDLLYSPRLTGTHDWSQIKMEVKPPKNCDSIRVQLFFETGTGTVMFDDVSLELIDPATSISMENKDVTIKEQETAVLNAKMEPADASSKISWFSSDNSVAIVDNNGTVTGVKAGEAVIMAVTDNGLTATSTVKVLRNDALERPAIEKLDLSPKELSLSVGQLRLLQTQVTPENADTGQLVWTSSNEEVASVKNGLVEAKSPGTAVISVATADGRIKSESQVTVTAAVQDEYDQLRHKWENQMTSLDYYDGSNERMKQMVASQTKSAQSLWRTMVKNKDRSFLWYEYRSNDNSADIRDSYRNLTTMAKAFANENSALYRNPQLLKDIEDALEWLYQNRYNENIQQYSNWWHWEIGVPNELNSIMVLLYDYLDQETIHRYLNVIDHFQPDPTKSGATTPGNYREAVGANRIDVSKVVGVRGVLVKDGAKIAAARDALSQTFENVTSGDGFYEDGSFVQHEDVAYTGSYGNVLIEGLTDLLDLLSGSTWAVTDPKVSNVYDWIENAFEPFMYKGALMDMVRGRAISRSFLQDHQAGQTITKVVIRMAQFAPEPYAAKYKSMAKSWLQEDTYLDYLSSSSNFKDMVLAKELLENQDIKPRGGLDYHKTFASMDRVVNRKPGYAFGISMYSNRIQNYEDMNDENRKGWYTGEGMTYLYNADLAQYSDDFWPTVDPYRMPGTTVDTMKRADGSGEHNSPESWVGGSTLDRFGTAGMSYKAWNSSLTAKKSWFMFDNEIVALGTGITSGDNRTIETIVENRKIRDNGSNELIINGEKPDLSDGQNHTTEAKWAYLEGNVPGSDIGYYFPGGKTLTLKKEQRTGAWKDINYGEPAKPITRSYATMWFDHGVNPANDTYSYVLLPSLTQEQTSQYAAQPEISILRNDTAVQAVQELKENIIGANFWLDEKQTVGPLTVYQKASIMMQEKDGVLTLAVSDPTMQNTCTIDIDFDGKAFEVLEADEQVEVIQTKPSIKLKVNVNQAHGKTFTVKLKMIPSVKGNSPHSIR
ncbi:polysaccharide lyase family 8 super-sandwich domain-containing protein [Neobacillus sp. 114]|uniref:polysaccharide lyase family 8 super-sandwich domain-containing protein n=1 Tax=Neobacillus sp. 114 TaxID=3048535 RepID=UPI0024C43CD5|nr:polysaccharide lyase family 8 super-sandwich domain-containing protein [Neobacillus sp. 114]